MYLLLKHIILQFWFHKINFHSSVVFIQGFALAAMFQHIAASPFILQTHYNLSAISYSICFGLNGLIVLGSKEFLVDLMKRKKESSWGYDACVYYHFVLSLMLPFLFVEVGFLTIIRTWTNISCRISALGLRNVSGGASALFGFLPFFQVRYHRQQESKYLLSSSCIYRYLLRYTICNINNREKL